MDNQAEGTLQVRVTTASGALPVQGATVILSDQSVDGNPGMLRYTAVTDRNGRTPSFVLPTKAKSMSEKPGQGAPYLEYRVQVRAPGFYPVTFEGAPVFDGVASTQPANLTPVPEGVTNPQPITYPPYSSTL